MYRKILVPIDGSKPADKALDHAINLVKSISVSSDSKTELTILYVIPDLPVPLGFEKPMRSFKTGKVISFSDFIKEMHESMRLSAVKMLSERKKKYESNINNATIRAEVIIGHGLSISNTIIEFADKEKIDLIVIGNIGLSGISKVKALGSVSRAIAERCWNRKECRPI
jgi:nucleotide-binding universal stress UspA family protein